MLLSESQAEKASDCMIPNIWQSRKGETMETVKSLGVTGGRAVRQSTGDFRTMKLLSMTP